MTSIRVSLFPLVPTSLKISGKFRLSGGNSGSHICCRAICYNETVYPEPQTYDPERFLKNGRLDSSVRDPEERVFGTGRRYVFANVTRSLTHQIPRSQDLPGQTFRSSKFIP